MNLWTFLLGAAGPLALRVIAALGIGVVTFTGVDTAFQALVTQAQDSWTALPSAVVALASIAGVPQGLALIIGAMSARVTAWIAVGATRWLVKA